jgi:hypothetical protein
MKKRYLECIRSPSYEAFLAKENKSATDLPIIELMALKKADDSFFVASK